MCALQPCREDMCRVQPDSATVVVIVVALPSGSHAQDGRKMLRKGKVGVQRIGDAPPSSLAAGNCVGGKTFPFGTHPHSGSCSVQRPHGACPQTLPLGVCVVSISLRAHWRKQDAPRADASRWECPRGEGLWACAPVKKDHTLHHRPLATTASLKSRCPPMMCRSPGLPILYRMRHHVCYADGA